MDFLLTLTIMGKFSEALDMELPKRQQDPF